MPRPTKHVPTQYLQSDAAKARGWNLSQNAPQDPEAARLPGNMPSSAPVVRNAAAALAQTIETACDALLAAVDCSGRSWPVAVASCCE